MSILVLCMEKIRFLSSLEGFQCCLKQNHCLNKTTVWSGTALGSSGTAHPSGSRDDMAAGRDEARCCLNLSLPGPDQDELPACLRRLHCPAPANFYWDKTEAPCNLWCSLRNRGPSEWEHVSWRLVGGLLFPLGAKASPGWGSSANRSPWAVHGVRIRARKETENRGAELETRSEPGWFVLGWLALLMAFATTAWCQQECPRSECFAEGGKKRLLQPQMHLPFFLPPDNIVCKMTQIIHRYLLVGRRGKRLQQK